MLVSLTFDYEFEDENDESILELKNYISTLFETEVKIEIPQQYTWSGYTNPFPTYCDMDEEDIPF